MLKPPGPARSTILPYEGDTSAAFFPLAPAALKKAAAAQAPDSWQAAATTGAACALRALHSPAVWLAPAVVFGAAAAGLSAGPMGAAVAAYPILRFLGGDGPASPVEIKPLKIWPQVHSVGALRLVEASLRRAGHSKTLAQRPQCRSVMLGLAVGLRGLSQLAGALAGLIGLVAALSGAAVGIVAHCLRRAAAALCRLPAHARRIFAKLQAQLSHCASMLSNGLWFIDRARRLSQSARRVWQRALAPVAGCGAWAAQLGRAFKAPWPRPPRALAALRRRGPIQPPLDGSALWRPALSVAACRHAAAVVVQRLQKSRHAAQHLAAHALQGAALAVHKARLPNPAARLAAASCYVARAFKEGLSNARTQLAGQ